MLGKLACRCSLALLLGALLAGACEDGKGGEGGGAEGGGGSSASSLPAPASSSGSGGSGTIACSSMFTNVPKGECDLLQQDCPPGRTCQPTSDGGPWTTECTELTGLKGPAEDCDVNSECQAGLFCVEQCTPVCCTATKEPCGGGACNVQVNFGDGMWVQMCGYAKRCHLLTADACDPGFDCHVEDAAQGLATCSTPSTEVVEELEPCTFLNDCHDMQDCFAGACRWYCFLDETMGSSEPGLGGCPEGESCRGAADGTLVDFGIEGIGVCDPD